MINIDDQIVEMFSQLRKDLCSTIYPDEIDHIERLIKWFYVMGYKDGRLDENKSIGIGGINGNTHEIYMKEYKSEQKFKCFKAPVFEYQILFKYKNSSMETRHCLSHMFYLDVEEFIKTERPYEDGVTAIEIFEPSKRERKQ